MRNVLVLPGWMTSLTLYENANDFEVCIGRLSEKSFAADHVIGISLGALVVLREAPHLQGRVILINPPLPKRNIFAWFFRWMNYVLHEGLFFQRQKFTTNPFLFCRELVGYIQLLTVDFSGNLDSLSAGKIVVIRGKNDRFFCDNETSDFLRSKNIELIEVDGGHNWCEAIEKAMSGLMQDSHETAS